MRAAEQGRTDPRPAMGFIVAVAFILRLVTLGSKSLWVDEAYLAGLMDRSLPELVSMSMRGSPHPPLAFVFTRLSTMLFGTGEFALRLVPAICSALAAWPLMSLVRRRTGRLRGALTAGALWAVAPYAVSLGQEAWLYGITAFLGFTFLELSDRAWRGSRGASIALVPVGLLGMLVNHLFALYVAAGFGLWLATPGERRRRIAFPLTLGGILAILYAPFLAVSMGQAGFRMNRIAMAGGSGLETLLWRLRFELPTVIARLVPGGIATELGLLPSSGFVQWLIWVLFGAGTLALLVVFLVRARMEPRLRWWLVCLLVAPVLLFLRESPTARHLSIMWVPLAFAVAEMARRLPRLSLAWVLAAVVLLMPYYRVRSFPYHRSDWRGAVEYVLLGREEGDGIVVMGSLSGGLIWDYYGDPDVDVLALRGSDPYSERAADPPDRKAVVDSMLTRHGRVWVLNDWWGGPSMASMVVGSELVEREMFGPALEVLLIQRRPDR